MKKLFLAMDASGVLVWPQNLPWWHHPNPLPGSKKKLVFPGSRNGQCVSFYIDMGVSENSGTPKWMVYSGKPLWKNGWFGGKTHYFRKHPYYNSIWIYVYIYINCQVDDTRLLLHCIDGFLSDIIFVGSGAWKQFQTTHPSGSGDPPSIVQ